LDNDGRLVGWRHRIVGQSIMAGTAFAAVRIKNGIDRTSLEGAANLPYAVPNMADASHTVRCCASRCDMLCVTL
jgi:isoquinoline 1-oxidoreductase subunit beta